MKAVPRLKVMFLSKALKKFEGSIGEEERFIKDMFSDIDLTNGERWEDSEGNWDHKAGITLNTCKIELA